MSPEETMERIDEQLTHVWVVRTFLKHSEEAEEEDELRQIHRRLYDYMLALGETWQNRDAAGYLKLARKKYSRLRGATEEFVALQPEVSDHTNFKMAARSLTTAVSAIGRLLDEAEPGDR